MLLLAYGGSAPWDAVDRIFVNLFEALIPIGICVILPIIVITLALRTRRHEIDKKTELMIKAVESGAQLDPAFFENAARTGRKERTAKDKLMGYLIAACITSGIGLLAGVVFTVLATSFSSKPEMIILLCILPCAILIAVGIAFFIAYAVGKRTWAKELAELNGEQVETQQ